MADISVIVPVYRAEQYFRRCVDSILSQSCRDFLLILVDDGSPDACPALCDDYAIRDPRVHVIHQANSGPSAARNNGIEWALTKSACRYLAFVDSDDCLHPQYLERLLTAAERSGAELVMCRHKYFRREEEIYPVVPLEEPVRPEPSSAEDLVVREERSFNYCWGKLFAASLFETLRFPEDVSFGEDNLTIYKAFFAAEKIAFFPEELYFYFYSPTGITKMSWSPRSLECFRGIREQVEFYRDNGYPNAFRTEVRALIHQYAYQIHRIREDKEHLKQNKPYLRTMLSEMRSEMAAHKALGLWDDYWLEALHPHLGAIRAYQVRIRNRLRRRKERQ